MVDADVFATELVAVAVTVAGLAAIAESAIAVAEGVLDGDDADRAGVLLGEQVPTIVNVVVGHRVAEDVAGADRELRGEAVGVFAVGVGVVV